MATSTVSLHVRIDPDIHAAAKAAAGQKRGQLARVVEAALRHDPHVADYLLKLHPGSGGVKVVADG